MIKFAFPIGLLVVFVAYISSTAIFTPLKTNSNPAVAVLVSPTPKLTPEKIIPSGLNNGVAHKMKYSNYAYGYSIPVPKGLVAYSNLPPMPQHGAGIVLSENPDSYLYFDGNYNALFWKSLDEAADVHLQWLKEDFPDARLQKKESSHLGGLPALRFVANYNRDGIDRIEETIIAFRDYEEVTIIYKISFDTTEERYSEDVTKFEEIINGWKLRKPE